LLDGAGLKDSGFCICMPVNTGGRFMNPWVFS
jgi:hypothetical protein